MGVQAGCGVAASRSVAPTGLDGHARTCALGLVELKRVAPWTAALHIYWSQPQVGASLRQAWTGAQGRAPWGSIGPNRAAPWTATSTCQAEGGRGRLRPCCKPEHCSGRLRRARKDARPGVNQAETCRAMDGSVNMTSVKQ